MARSWTGPVLIETGERVVHDLFNHGPFRRSGSLAGPPRAAPPILFVGEGPACRVGILRTLERGCLSGGEAPATRARNVVKQILGPDHVPGCNPGSGRGSDP